jgi:hypothetical protein
MVPYMAMSPIATGTSHHSVPVPSPSVSYFSDPYRRFRYTRTTLNSWNMYSLLDTVRHDILHTVQVGFRTSHHSVELPSPSVSYFSDPYRRFRYTRTTLNSWNMYSLFVRHDILHTVQVGFRTSHHSVELPSQRVSYFSDPYRRFRYTRTSLNSWNMYSLFARHDILHIGQVGFRTSHVPRRVSCFSDPCRSFRHIDSVFLSQKFLVFNPGPHVWSQTICTFPVHQTAIIFFTLTFTFWA